MEHYYSSTWFDIQVKKALSQVFVDASPMCNPSAGVGWKHQRSTNHTFNISTYVLHRAACHSKTTLRCASSNGYSVAHASSQTKQVKLTCFPDLPALPVSRSGSFQRPRFCR